MPTFKNILIVRTDRIGDVVLTTPAIRALKKAFPEAKLSILIPPGIFPLLENHPDLDEILFDDRKNQHHGIKGFLRQISQLRKKKFDLAVIYHTKRRTNLLCFFAGIPNRLGYRDKNHGFLLTMPVDDDRIKGEKHEAQYCLDLLQKIGLQSNDLTMRISTCDREALRIQYFLSNHGIGAEERFIVFHLTTSDAGRQWPWYRFLELAQEIHKRQDIKIVLVGAQNAVESSRKLAQKCGSQVVNLAGETTLKDLVAILNRCDLLISNDSGPSHIAAALNKPVVSIFTRNQPGINPTRWKPLGDRSRYVSVDEDQSQLINLSYKKSGQIDSKYLEIITVGQVLEAVDAIYKLC